ncbi:MAG: tripartite tricarboxylate transporter permease [Thermodesulfobacteriota bacterium]|nr:tripartite tricarboxylate transporter permease [Thermodesulfobacteriota bacterium]
MEMWLAGLQVAVQPMNMLYLLGGTIFGLIIGALPGLGPMFAVTLALPLTFGIPAATAIIMLSAIHAATVFGGSLPSILINTPGTVGSVPTCWDGFPMSQQGKSGYALGISAGGSLLGGVIGWFFLVVTAPLLIALALMMGPAEYFMIAVLALSLISMASQGQTIKGVILGAFGLLISYIGRDPIWGGSRFTFGSMFLEDGLPIAVVFVGLFAVSQAIVLFEKGGSVMEVGQMKESVMSGVIDVFRRPITVIRGGIIGVLLGIMPALGISTASVIAYLVEKRSSKHPETFGKGDPAGLLAPEVANNACLVGDLIPTLTLGIPGSGVTALFMAALIMHGIQPGPDYFSKGSLPYAVFVGILIAQFAFFILGLLSIGQMAKIVKFPLPILVPAIITLSFLGGFAIRKFTVDVLITFSFGLLGYILVKGKWPIPCFVLGFVLGDIMESNFHRALLIGKGSYLTFIARPGSLFLFICAIMVLAWPYLKPLLFKPRKGTIVAEAVERGAGMDEDEK